MKFSNQKSNPSQLKSLNIPALNKEKLQKTKGGFLFRAMDDLRCSIDRSFARLLGRNGDGDW